MPLAMIDLPPPNNPKEVWLEFLDAMKAMAPSAEREMDPVLRPVGKFVADS
jgi:hypothetical protein